MAPNAGAAPVKVLETDGSRTCTGIIRGIEHVITFSESYDICVLDLSLGAEPRPYYWDDGFAWDDGFDWDDGFARGDGFAWDDGFAWGDGFAWDDGFSWDDGSAWNDGFSWDDG